MDQQWQTYYQFGLLLIYIVVIGTALVFIIPVFAGRTKKNKT